MSDISHILKQYTTAPGPNFNKSSTHTKTVYSSSSYKNPIYSKDKLGNHSQTLSYILIAALTIAASFHLSAQSAYGDLKLTPDSIDEIVSK